MECPVVFLLILATITSETTTAFSQNIYASENPLPVGSNVTLFSRSSVPAGAWMFNSNIIVMIFPGDKIIADTWRDRVIFNSTTSSLTIRSLQVEDSGLYTLQALNLFRSELTLSVQVPISNVTLRANATNLVEFNDTAVLMCTVSNGSSLSYVWLKGNSVVTAGGGVQLSDGGATLIIVRVTRYDEGPFRCNVSNGISQEISLPVHLNISYGPSNTTMMIMPMKYIYRTGSNILLSCSAESSPAAMIRWMVNGVYLNDFSPQLQLEMVTESRSGNYQCLFYNTATSRFTSASAMIRILAPIAAVVVNHTGGRALLNEPFTMYCEVNGSVDNIQWWKNGQLISADNTTVFDTGNTTLTLNPVQHSDNGNYQCQAFNYVSNMTSSPYTVKVNYGPMKPVIIGPSMALTGTWVILNCSSASYPPSLINWYFNNSLVATTSKLEIGPLTLNMSGKYSCMAFNNITGKNSSASVMLTVLAPVTMVSIKIVGPLPIQNHTFTLTCETTGSVESIIWMYNWYQLYPDNTRNFSKDNTILTFDPVVASDNGNYQCVASNPLSSSNSEIFKLEVIYGPEKPTIMGPNMAMTEDNITLSCYASSNPVSIYKWFFNDSVVANTSEYVTPPLTRDMSGMYTCMAYNNITGKNSTAYTMLTVLAPVTMAAIKIIGPLPIQNHTFTLTCETTGSVESIIWMYNWNQLYPDNTRNFSMNNTILTFDPVMASDNGNYQCVASNPLSSSTSEIFTLEVFYGPEKPTIMGPNMAKTGDNVTLSCYASSNPVSIYKWFFNDSVVANTSEYVTPPLTRDMSGMYTCMAYNNITGKNSTAYTMLTVLAPVTMASIKIVGPPPIQNHTFTLTCETTGSVDSIMWTYYWSPLYPDNTRNFSMDNTILTFAYGKDQRDHMSNPQLLRSYIHHLVYKWFFNDSVVANTSEYVTPPFTRDMSGMYTCMAYNNITGKNSTAYTMLTVIDPIMVHVKAPMNPPIEGHFYNLTCNVTGPTEHIYWLKNDEPLHENNRTVFYMNNKTVTFNPLEQTDTGNYQCMAVNTVWSMTSSPFHLLVNFGPETPIIDGPAFAETGHTAKFSCSAKSVPPSQYLWIFNDSTVANTSEFTTGLLSFNMSGEYTCMALNYVTENSSISIKMLTVIEAIESVMIRNNTVPINSENFTLTCEVNGPYDTIYWMKDNMYLNTSTAKANMSYKIENNTLHFTPLTMYNDGIYQCVATNQAGPHASPQYVLLVNYGPLKVHILGPDSAKVGSSVSLTCSAASQPDCDFNWFLNSQSSAIKTGSVITFPATKENEGNYTCKAKNPVTNITMYQIKAFTVDHASTLHIPSNMMLMVLVALSVTALFN
ncbi:carcinoembryonic antigen-related cell adhesion molecule 1 [Morone saxatilis]|uniref:carcinoembryonic antigen-related cell adhesion molecule 1 n=1 Tax=Morone saxatilis TaxID=34816 RepID=UPI0015E22D5E|nr:carcinoembryonic antigen-related cell adhesion molecule 1 [Morone saxatilis]